MEAILLNVITDLFKDGLSWIVGIIALIIVCAICYFIGQLGVQIKSGIVIMQYMQKIELEARAKNMIINEKGILLKKKGRKKIILPILTIIAFYSILFYFLEYPYQYLSLLGLIPILLGYFGIFLVPEEFSDD